jgi:hypothetical protein
LAESNETEKQEGKENDAEKAEDGKPAITEQWSQTKLKKEYRKFNLDLAPKVIFYRILQFILGKSRNHFGSCFSLFSSHMKRQMWLSSMTYGADN